MCSTQGLHQLNGHGFIAVGCAHTKMGLALVWGFGSFASSMCQALVDEGGLQHLVKQYSRPLHLQQWCLPRPCRWVSGGAESPMHPSLRQWAAPVAGKEPQPTFKLFILRYNTQKSANIVSVQLNKFLKTKHTCVTTIIQKHHITWTTEDPSSPFQAAF